MQSIGLQYNIIVKVIFESMQQYALPMPRTVQALYRLYINICRCDEDG